MPSVQGACSVLVIRMSYYKQVLKTGYNRLYKPVFLLYAFCCEKKSLTTISILTCSPWEFHNTFLKNISSPDSSNTCVDQFTLYSCVLMRINVRKSIDIMPLKTLIY